MWEVKSWELGMGGLPYKCLTAAYFTTDLSHAFFCFSMLAGTPDYMSPQLTAAKVQGKALYDGTKADVWALGDTLMLLYRADVML